MAHSHRSRVAGLPLGFWLIIRWMDNEASFGRYRMSRGTGVERERVTLVETAAILGVPIRTVQRLANNRQLPTAAKIGRLWTFNEAAIRAWLVEQESIQPCQRIERKPQRAATGEVVHSGRASPSPERNTGSASRQVIRSLRAGAKPRSTHG